MGDGDLHIPRSLHGTRQRRSRVRVLVDAATAADHVDQVRLGREVGVCARTSAVSDVGGCWRGGGSIPDAPGSATFEMDAPPECWTTFGGARPACAALLAPPGYILKSWPADSARRSRGPG